MNEGKVKIAAGLVPLIKWLYEGGITSVGYADVHCSESFFRETFPVYEVHERNSDVYPYELAYTFEGVKFFCLTTKNV